GFTSTLSSTGAVSYTWNPGALTGSAMVVSPPAGTSVYSVTGATAFGCLTTNTLSLLVNPTPTITPSLSSPSICVGSSATLSAIGAASYTWNPGALSGSAVAVSPITTTNYTVAATSSAGCAGQNTITLIVVPNPTVTASSNPTAVCLGASSTLSATGANSYTWIPGVITGSSTIVSPLVSTIYTVTGVTLACSNTKTVSLTINPLPSLTISSTSNPICSTNSATLSGTGAVTYTWLPGPITASAITVTPPVSTVYTLSGTGPLGCQNALIYTLTVNPTPTLLPLASSPTICAGFTSSLSVTGAVNYTFNPGGLTGSMVTVSPTVSTTYTVLGTTAFCASSQTVQVTVNPLPVIVSGSTPTNLCTGSTASLSASGAATYTWLPGNVSGSLITVNPMTTTIYTITATSSLGCVNSSTLSQLVSVSPTVTASSSSTVVCAGIPATLTAMGANTYTWMPGALTGSSIVVSPTVNTTYSVTGGNGTICNHSITITLSVNPLPPVLAATSNTSLCIGNSVTLTASGAVNYTWNPGGALTPSIVLSPTITGTYTLTGIDANGCSQQSVISVTVFNNPTITAVASPSTICDGNTTTLTSTGANTYTWIPGALLGSSVTATPSLSTTYTVNGKDLNGCADTETTLVNVLPNPVFSITAASPSICIGGSNILTATGALNYTWMPGAITNSVAVVNPTVTTTYTAVATNTTVCFTALTTTVFVNPLPANVTATTQGMITCASQTANLLATSSSSNLTYYWNGPLSFSSAVQNPTAVTVWGGFTVTITNTITGCIAAATTTILTDYSIPLVTQSPSLMLTCAVPVGTLLTVHTTTNPGYSWTGPSGYTSTAVTSTVTAPGNYSLIITDLSSGCTGTAMVSVGIHTAVVATASIAPATCSAGLSLNNGTIKVFNFIGTHKYALVAGSSFTGNVTYTTATGIPTTGIISNTLVNPTNTVVYTLRLFDVEGCIKDTALILQPVNCVISTLGLAKAVSLPTTNIDGTYNVTYTITAKSYDTTSFNNVSLTDKLNLAFPAPLTFTVVNPPSSISGTGLNLNAAFDGITNFSLTTASSSTMAAGASASFSFTVKIKTTSFYKPYYNSVVGVVKNGIGATVRDTSNVGFDTSPQKNVPTSVTFTPYVSFGLTKEGGVAIQNNNSLDISYTISVHNLGNDTLKHIVVKDSLLATVQQPANFSLKSGPVTGGGLTANSTFDGIYDLNLLSSENILPPGAVGKVSFVINVFPDTVTRLINSAYGTARYRPYATSLGFLTVSDLSNAGTKPDANNNGNCNEPSDNEPTVLMLPPTYTLFIPEGFSPDGDNINDLFVIKGLPRGSNSSLTIFNRWGNRVFYAENYSETTPWDGTPNIAGTFGKEKLPQGTYYYVLEMKGSENRSVTGFIVLQY
ncbi:MAG: gliding motility-associated C-terminal domain-containing protein, partial [bacterium]|nr:gliding motility-associated C-terminal domain-containing protein [bacterium]